jgi:hypothetical protein
MSTSPPEVVVVVPAPFIVVVLDTIDPVPVGVVVVVVPPEPRPLAHPASSAAAISDVVTDVFGILVLPWLPFF